MARRATRGNRSVRIAYGEADDTTADGVRLVHRHSGGHVRAAAAIGSAAGTDVGARRASFACGLPMVPP